MMNKVKDGLLNQISPKIMRGEIRADPLVGVIGVFMMVLMVGAEAVTISVGVLPGAILYGVLLIGLVNLYYFRHTPEDRQIYLALTLIPLLRILSLVMPIPHAAPIFWFVLVGFPLLLSAGWVIRINGLPSLRLNLTWLEWASQVMFGSSGIPIGWIASMILPRAPLVVNSGPVWIILGAIILALFNGLTEEIIFRGLLQKAFSYPFGFFSFFFSSILYASLFLGTVSPGYIVFSGLTGLLFGFWVQISDSLWGVILAHSLMNIVFFLLIPLH